MLEKKFVQIKKDELAIKEFVKEELGKGKISDVRIEYTPVGEKIIVHTSKPGIIIGRRGEKIADLSETLKKKFKLENPNLEIAEVKKPEFDAQSIADELALQLERFGPLSFKIIAYKMLQRIRSAGALGAEIRLSGRLPSERAKSWRFAFGFLKKIGDTAKIVDKKESIAHTQPGSVGIKVSILPPDAQIHDRIEISKEIISEAISKREMEKVEKEEAEKEVKKKKRGIKKNILKKTRKKIKRRKK